METRGRQLSSLYNVQPISIKFKIKFVSTQLYANRITNNFNV